MKKTISLLVVVTLVLLGCASSKPAKSSGKATSTSTVEVAGPVKMSKKAKVTISGQGFTPGQEITILFTAKDGVESDIGYALKPSPKVSQSGSWTTTWSCGRFISKKLVKAGKSYKITVTDSEYNPLADTTVSFVK